MVSRLTQLGIEEIRAYRLHLIQRGLKATSLYPIIGALRFFYGVTLGQKGVLGDLLKNAVCSLYDARGNGHANSFCCPLIYDQRAPLQHLNGQIGGPCPLQNLVRDDRHPGKRVNHAGAISEQPSRRCLASGKQGWQLSLSGKLRNALSVRKNIRCLDDYDRLRTMFRDLRKGLIQFGFGSRAFDPHDQRLEPNRNCCCAIFSLNRDEPARIGSRQCVVAQNRYPRNARQCLFEEFELLRGLLNVEAGNSRGITARAAHFTRKAKRDRIRNDGEYNRRPGGRLLRSSGCHSAIGHDQVDFEPNELFRKLRMSVQFPFSPPGLEYEVPTFNVAQIGEILSKLVIEDCCRCVRHDAYPMRLCGLFSSGTTQAE